MTLWPLIILGLGLAYLAQMALSLKQMKSFSTAYADLRRKGKVAIGMKKSAFTSGAIVMHCVNDDGEIIDSRKISGITILAKCQDFPGFVGKNIKTITTEDCRRMPKSVRKATANARDNYLTIMGGGTVEEQQSPLGQLGTKIKCLLRKREE